jgi:hypothetical protein
MKDIRDVKVIFKFTGKTKSGEINFYIENGMPTKVVGRCTDGKRESTQNLTGYLGALFRSAVFTWTAQKK